MQDPVYEFIKNTISETAKVPVSDIRDSDNFQDILDMDSLEAIEVLYKIEKEYRIKFGDVDLDNVQTLRQIYEKAIERINEQ